MYVAPRKSFWEFSGDDAGYRRERSALRYALFCLAVRRRQVVDAVELAANRYARSVVEDWINSL